MSHLKNSPNWPFWAFSMNFCPKCEPSSLRSQSSWMRLFLRFSNTVCTLVSKNRSFLGRFYSNQITHFSRFAFEAIPDFLWNSLRDIWCRCRFSSQRCYSRSWRYTLLRRTRTITWIAPMRFYISTLLVEALRGYFVVASRWQIFVTET